MSDTWSIRQAAGEFDYPPAPVIRDEAELVELLDEQAAGAGVWLGNSDSSLDGYELAVFTVRPASAARVAALLAYIWQGPMRGEWSEHTPVEVIADHLYVFSVDATKSQRDDVGDAWATAQRILSEGTPVRTTDRAGSGTKGTRAVEGVGPVLLAWR
jgi:hypothetical protein